MRRLIEPDPRSVILREAEARQGYKSHAETARASGLNINTIQKRFRVPGSARLDEIRAIVGNTLKPEECWELITGRKWK